jgi:hypothetical protein
MFMKVVLLFVVLLSVAGLVVVSSGLRFIYPSIEPRTLDFTKTDPFVEGTRYDREKALRRFRLSLGLFLLSAVVFGVTAAYRFTGDPVLKLGLGVTLSGACFLVLIGVAAIWTDGRYNAFYWDKLRG